MTSNKIVDHGTFTRNLLNCLKGFPKSVDTKIPNDHLIYNRVSGWDHPATCLPLPPGKPCVLGM